MEYSGAGGNWFMKKTRSEKSRDTVPLKGLSYQIREALTSFGLIDLYESFYNFSVYQNCLAKCLLALFPQLSVICRVAGLWSIVTPRLHGHRLFLYPRLAGWAWWLRAHLFLPINNFLWLLGWRVSMVTTWQPCSANPLFALVIGVVGEHNDYLVTLFLQSKIFSGYLGGGWALSMMTSQSPCSANPHFTLVIRLGYVSLVTTPPTPPPPSPVYWKMT